MARYIARRLVLMVLVIVGMSIITFSLSRLVPGNPARLLAGPHARQEQVDALAERYHLTGTIPEQYAVYMSGLLHGDLGLSVTTRRPVADDLAQYLPATIELTLTRFHHYRHRRRAARHPLRRPPREVVRPRLAAPLHRRSFAADLLARSGAAGPVLQASRRYCQSAAGSGPSTSSRRASPAPISSIRCWPAISALFGSALLHLILPALTLAAGSLAVVTRMMRASILETMGADYVRTARAKGLAEPSLLRRHVLRNAFIPTLTVLGLQVGYLLAGNFLVESSSTGRASGSTPSMPSPISIMPPSWE